MFLLFRADLAEAAYLSQSLIRTTIVSRGYKRQILMRMRRICRFRWCRHQHQHGRAGMSVLKGPMKSRVNSINSSCAVLCFTTSCIRSTISEQAGFLLIDPRQRQNVRHRTRADPSPARLPTFGRNCWPIYHNRWQPTTC